MECVERVRDGHGNPYAKDFETAVRIEFVDALREWAEEVFMADVPVTGIASDLLNGAWGRIDWHDLARHYLSELDLEALERGEE